MKKVITYGFFALVLVFILLLLTPWLFKEEIFEKVKTEANNALIGELSIDDVSLSLISDFPNLSLKLYNLRYVGEGNFQGEELFSIAQIRAELDLLSVLNGDKIDVKEIAIVSPKLNVQIRENGEVNYLILKEDDAPQEPTENTDEVTIEESSFTIGIQEFIIEELNLIYNDKEGDMFAEITNGNINLSGDFTAVDVAIKTAISMDELTYKLDDISYLNKVAIDADVEANYNQSSGKLALKDNRIFVNKLQLLFNGWLQSFDERVALDLSFNAPNGNFKEVLSLIPAFYLTGYESVKASGNFNLSGNVSGDYFYEGDNLPGFAIDLSIDNGKIQYPDLPSAITNIDVNTSINHPQGKTDLLKIDVAKLKLNMAGSPFFATAKLASPMSDPAFDFTVKTQLDLHQLTQVYPVEDQSVSGILDADAHVAGKLSDFENETYEKVEATGWINTKNLHITSSMLAKKVIIDTASMVVSPKNFTLNPLILKVGESDFDASGKLDNLLNYALTDDTLQGAFALNSNYVNVTELMNLMVEESESASNNSEGETAPTGQDTTASSETTALEVPANLDLKLQADMKKVLYDNIELTNLSGAILVKNGEVDFNKINANVLNGKAIINGKFATPNKVPTVDFDFKLNKIAAKTAFTTFNTVQSFAPVAQSASGNVSTNFTYSGTLNNEFEPDLNSVSASGKLRTLGLVMEPEIMAAVANLLKNNNYKKIRVEDADLSFEIKDGRASFKPVDVKMGGHPATFSGSHGLDQTIDYLIETEVPTNEINLPESIKVLNVVGETIPLKLNITGTFKNPKIAPVFANATNVKDAVSNVVNTAIDKAKDSLNAAINQQKIKLLEAAQKQADALVAEAQKQANALKDEAAKQAANLKQEAQKQADALIEEAKGDPLKEFGARAAAKAVLKEADKQIDKLQAEANKQANNLVLQADQQAAKILAEAEEKANNLGK